MSIVASFETGSTHRARTIAANAPSPRTSNPSRTYASTSTCHNTCDSVPVTTACPATAPPAVAPELVLMLEVALREVRSNVSWPGRSRARAASISTASWLSSCAEPMCSIPTTCRPCLWTICTALAPEAVGTFRMNEATSEVTNHPVSYAEQPTTKTSPQVTAPRHDQSAKSGTSQA